MLDILLRKKSLKLYFDEKYSKWNKRAIDGIVTLLNNIYIGEQ